MVKKFRVVLDGELYEVEVDIEEGLSDLEALLQAFKTGVVKRVTTEAAAAATAEGAVPAPITGRVVEVRVKNGDHVERGTTVAVLEAMKTKVEVKANRSGVVRDILVKEGEVARQGQPLLILE
jgi:biotin carboxyl carrier protein